MRGRTECRGNQWSEEDGQPASWAVGGGRDGMCNVARTRDLVVAAAPGMDPGWD